jgi:glycosyltransferase involved in cell wall biosynthesis
MKILFPVEVFYPSQAGGTANSVHWLARMLFRHGFEPRIVATNKGISDQVSLNKWQKTDAGRTIFIKTRFLHVPIAQSITSLRHLREADVVHLSSIFFPTAFITAFAARLLGKKIAWSPNGELAGVALSHSAGRKRPILWLIKKCIGTSPVFHSTSNEETEDILKVVGRNARIRRIPNYVEIESFVERTEGNYLLFMGRLHPQKALDNLIKALSLSEAFLRSDLVLKIAGKGKPEYEQTLRQIISDMKMETRVTFVGQIEGHDKLRLLADARVTILPSHAENFGIVVLESLAQGTPVIASTHTPWESLEKEMVGFWVENSPEELAKAVDRLLLMKSEEYAGYRSRGREYVMREFDIRNHVDEWLDFYDAFR